MGKRLSIFKLSLCFLWLSFPSAGLGQEASRELTVLTFNVWHGLRSGENRWRFPGEDPQRAEQRFAWQIEEIRALDPDVLLFQEVNPNQKQSRRYAQALGYDEIHKVTSCGIHLGALFKIPRNVNEGIAILAKPELALQRVDSVRLSGNAKCSASWGVQTKESRYALFGQITVAGQPILLATVHLFSAPFLLADFEENLDRLVEGGDLEPSQRDQILEQREAKRSRNTVEVQRLLDEIASRRRGERVGASQLPVILGGDFNAEPDTPGIVAMREAGYREAGRGSAFHTWNPVNNHLNYEIGTRRVDPLPTFGSSEVEKLLGYRHTTPRQIDHLFVSPEIEIVEARLVLDRDREEIYPSDHFGLLATIRIPAGAR